MTGSLGCFDLETASEISRQIKQLLQQHQALKPPEIAELEQLITQLKEEIERYGCENQIKQIEYLPSIPNISSLSLLIVDDDLPLAQQMAKEATNWGFKAEIALNLKQAEEFLTHDYFDVILLDINFSNTIKNGLDFLAIVHKHDPEIPIVILTAKNSFIQRVKAARLGSKCFLQKPISPAEVLATITQIIQPVNQSVAKLLIVDDDPGLLNLLTTLLEPFKYHLTLLNQPEKFWEILEQTAPDLLILDVEFSVIQKSEKDTINYWSGFDLCQVVRTDSRWNRLPILFLSSHNDLETIQRGFTVGADDFLTKPIVATELITRIRTRLEQRKLWKMTEKDALTGLSLRRKALQDMTRLLQLAKRQQQPFSLAVLDLDNFKYVNDQYGHEMGDQVLNYFGKILNQSFRQEDVVGRWGGEEFVVGMYGTGIEDGIKKLTQLLQQFSQYSFTSLDGTRFQVTFSGGIVQTPDHGEDLQTLYQKADMSLYQAKAEGRNRICSVNL